MIVSVEHIKERPGLEKIREAFYSLFFFFMPFTQALTFDIGFPLKISELALLVLSFMYLFFNKRTKFPQPVIICLAALFVVVLTSTIVNILWEYPYPLRTYPARFGYVADSVARFIYFVFAIFSFLVSVDILLADKNKYISVWIYGAIAAAIYSWYLMLSSLLKLPVLLLPGMHYPLQTLSDGIIRCGTFLEGNYMGLYLVLSAAMSFYIKKYKTALFLLASVITTFSLLGVFSAVILFFVCYWRFLFEKKNRRLVVGGSILFAVLMIYFSQTPFYAVYVHQKLFHAKYEPGKVSEGSFSRIDRLSTLETTVNTALGNPVLGVGPSNFARHYDHFYKQGNLNDSMYQVLRKKNVKVIPNSNFMEIWSETGTISLLIFITFLIFLAKYAKTDNSNALFTALICMIICFNAYPSFIMIYLWAFMALPVAHFIQIRQQPGEHKP